MAMPMHDTVKRVDPQHVIQETLKREELWQIQTPQTFRYDWLLEAHQQAQLEQWEVTDDAALIERKGHQVSVVEGSCFNIKITRPDDLIFGEAILNRLKLSLKVRLRLRLKLTLKLRLRLRLRLKFRLRLTLRFLA